MVVAFLPGDFLALFLSDSLTLLLLFKFSLCFRNLRTVLFSGVTGHLLVFSVTFLPGHIFAVLFGNIIAHLIGDLLAHLLGLAIALLLGYNRGHWLLDIMTSAHWNRTTDWLVGGRADFISNIVSVGNRLSVAILLGNLLAILLGHLLTLLSRLIPTLLSRFIPALLVSIHIGTFLFSY